MDYNLPPLNQNNNYASSSSLNQLPSIYSTSPAEFSSSYNDRDPQQLPLPDNPPQDFSPPPENSTKSKGKKRKASTNGKNVMTTDGLDGEDDDASKVKRV